MTTLHIKRGIEFKARLYDEKAPKPWLEAVGAKLAEAGVSVRVGTGAGAQDIPSAAALVAFYERYESDPAATAAAVGIAEGTDLQEYIGDLVEALDDVVKRSSELTSGVTVDLSTHGDLAKTLGLEASNQTYATSGTGFATDAPAQGTMSVLGVQLARESSVADPFDGVPVMTAATFAGTGRQATGRNALEFEAVRRLDGIGGAELVELMASQPDDRVLRRMRKAKDQEAFTLGYSGIGYDKMRWDSRAHRVREMNPHVSLTVESSRMELDTDSNEYEVSQGTDYFWDRYYVAKDPTDPSRDALLDNSMSVRARVRYDQPGEARRLLIQSKIGSDVDENGMKSAAKQDIRRDSPTDAQIAMLDEATRSGSISWRGGAKEPIEAMAEVHAELAARGALPDVGPHEDVLQLELGAHVFSVRSRYHLNETSSRSQRDLFNQGAAWMEEVKGLVESSTTVGAADKDAVLASLAGLLDKTAIVDRVRDAFAALDPSVNAADVTPQMLEPFWPTASRSSNKLDNKKRRAVADALKAAHDGLAEQVDELRRDIAGARDPDARDHRFAEELTTFMKTKFSGMATTTTFGPFLKKLDAELAGTASAAFISEFGQWLADNEGDRTILDAPDAGAAMAGVRKNLVDEHLDILHRQLEASGTMAQALWFDDARRVWASASPQTSNFLIDTFDYVKDISPKDWETLSPRERDGRDPIPADKVYNADIISEVQIELGYEKPYVSAIEKANLALDGARAGLLMDFALADGLSGVVASEPRTFLAFVDGVKGQSDWDRQATLDRLNQFASGKGSPLAFDEDALGRLSEELFTTARQGQPTDGHAQLVEDLETVSWLWDTVVGAQDSIADLRGRRVVREAERAGAAGISWNESAMSKGETALTRAP